MVIKPCGSHSFPREDNEYRPHLPADPRQIQSAGSSPQRSFTSSSKCKALIKCTSTSTTSTTSSKNPYSTRGLDKFTTLLTEIEERRQSIYSKFNPDEISLVRFDFSNDNNGKPIVVKVKPNKDQIHKCDDRTRNGKINPSTTISGAIVTKSMIRSRSELGPVRKVDKEDKNDDEDAKKMKKSNTSCRWEASKLMQELKKPSYYIPATFVLILVLLVMFGRSAAIICTSIGWYLIPSNGPSVGNSNVSLGLGRRSFKRNKLVGGQVSLSFKSQTTCGKRKLSSPPGSFKGLNRRDQSSSSPPHPHRFCIRTG